MISDNKELLYVCSNKVSIDILVLSRCCWEIETVVETDTLDRMDENIKIILFVSLFYIRGIFRSILIS